MSVYSLFGTKPCSYLFTDSLLWEIIPRYDFYLDPLLNSTSGFNGHMSIKGSWPVNVNDPGLSERYFLDVMRKGEVKVVIRYSNEPQVFLS